METVASYLKHRPNASECVKAIPYQLATAEANPVSWPALLPEVRPPLVVGNDHNHVGTVAPLLLGGQQGGQHARLGPAIKQKPTTVQNRCDLGITIILGSKTVGLSTPLHARYSEASTRR